MASGGASKALLGVARSLRLTEGFRRLGNMLPRRAYLRLQAFRMRLRARAGELADVPQVAAMVPADDLREKYREAIRLLEERQTGEVGDYLEFGVYAGSSLGCMHDVVQERRLENVRLFGFDSFEGLPDTTGDNTAPLTEWQAGDFAMPIEATRRNLTDKGVDWDRVRLVKGFYDDTLAKGPSEYGIRKAGVIMLDCDLYSSTRTALEFCEPLIQDAAVLFFDDWWPQTLGAEKVGQRQAFEELLSAHPELSTTEIESYQPEYAKAFLVERRGRG